MFNFLAAIYAANAKPYNVESYESYEYEDVCWDFANIWFLK
jgi:hypothetical protein